MGVEAEVEGDVVIAECLRGDCEGVSAACSFVFIGAFEKGGYVAGGEELAIGTKLEVGRVKGLGYCLHDDACFGVWSWMAEADGEATLQGGIKLLTKPVAAGAWLEDLVEVLLVSSDGLVVIYGAASCTEVGLCAGGKACLVAEGIVYGDVKPDGIGVVVVLVAEISCGAVVLVQVCGLGIEEELVARIEGAICKSYGIGGDGWGEVWYGDAVLLGEHASL